MRELHRNPDGSLANPYEQTGWNTERVVWEENLAEFFECVAMKAEEYDTYMRRWTGDHGWNYGTDSL